MRVLYIYTIEREEVNIRMSQKRPSDWIDHVKAYKKEHPGLPFKEVVLQAKATYKRPKKEPKPSKPHPWMNHLKRLKEEMPDWKTKMTYKQFLIKAKETYTKAEKKNVRHEDNPKVSGDV